MQEVKFLAEAAIRAARIGETALRKAWSLMEAAAEKKRPSELMSQAAIRRMQGQQKG